MAQSQKSRNSEGVCEKIYNAISPFRASMHRISNHPIQPQAFISATTDPTPRAQLTNHPAKTSPPLIKPVHIVHQPSLSKTIPIESEPSVPSLPVQKIKKLKEDKREIAIVAGESNDHGTSSTKDVAQGLVKKASMKKTRSRKDNESIHETSDEGIFSAYINKVKNEMIRTMSNAGGGNGKSSSTRRDSFNDKVTSYINGAKIKIRKTTNVGDEKGFSIK